jgi:hypothetical protein
MKSMLRKLSFNSGNSGNRTNSGDASFRQHRPLQPNYNAVVSISCTEEEIVNGKSVTFYIIDVLIKNPVRTNSIVTTAAIQPPVDMRDAVGPPTINTEIARPQTLKTVRKRYSDFVELREQILRSSQNTHAHIEPKHFIFPGKTVVSPSKSNSIIVTRRIAFEAYLNYLLSLYPVPPEIVNFLDLDDEDGTLEIFQPGSPSNMHTFKDGSGHYARDHAEKAFAGQSVETEHVQTSLNTIGKDRTTGSWLLNDKEKELTSHSSYGSYSVVAPDDIGSSVRNINRKDDDDKKNSTVLGSIGKFFGGESEKGKNKTKADGKDKGKRKGADSPLEEEDDPSRMSLIDQIINAEVPLDPKVYEPVASEEGCTVFVIATATAYAMVHAVCMLLARLIHGEISFSPGS